jgi:O-acetyl-ADP-ribose deacetylase (regulator of RNase III)
MLIVTSNGSVSGARTKYIAEAKLAPEEGNERALFTQTEDSLSRSEANNFLSEYQGRPADDSGYEIIVSLRDRKVYQTLGETKAERDQALKNAVRLGLEEMFGEMRLRNTKWVAAIHHNTDNPHVHIIINKEGIDSSSGRPRRIEDIPRSWLIQKDEQISRAAAYFERAFNQAERVLPPPSVATKTIPPELMEKLPPRQEAGPKRDAALEYLTGNKEIHGKIVETMLANGSLYVSQKGHNVFLRRDATGAPTGYTSFKESSEDEGWFYIGDPQTANKFVLTDNPLEAASLNALVADTDLSKVCFVAVSGGLPSESLLAHIKTRSESKTIKVVWSLNHESDNQAGELAEVFKTGLKEEMEPGVEQVSWVDFRPRATYGRTWNNHLMHRHLQGELEAIEIRTEKLESPPIEKVEKHKQHRVEARGGDYFAVLREADDREIGTIYQVEAGGEYLVTSVNNDVRLFDQFGSIDEAAGYIIEESLLRNDVANDAAVLNLSGAEKPRLSLEEQETVLADNQGAEDINLAESPNGEVESKKRDTQTAVTLAAAIEKNKPSVEEIRSQRGEAMREMTAQLKATPLKDVLPRLGLRNVFEEGEWVWRDTGKQFKIFVTGQLFSDRKDNFHGGRGAIDLVRHVRGVEFKEARAWLADNFGYETQKNRQQVSRGEGQETSPPVAREVEEEKPKILTMPPANQLRLEQVRAYLTGERGISSDIVESGIRNGTIYANSFGSAVFVHRSPEGEVVGGTWRATAGTKRGNIEGTDKKRGWFYLGNLNTATRFIITEAPIEAMSWVDLHRHEDLSKTAVISVSGNAVQRNLLSYLAEKGDQITLSLAQNNDDGGLNGFYNALEMAGRFNLLRHKEGVLSGAIQPVPFSGQVERLAPALNDWNDELLALREQEKLAADQEHIEAEIALAEETAKEEKQPEAKAETVIAKEEKVPRQVINTDEREGPKLFTSGPHIIVNPSNTVGVMGAGVAREIASRYKGAAANFKRACEVGDVAIGEVYSWQSASRTVITHLPTKTDWREASQYQYVWDGLAALERDLRDGYLASVIEAVKARDERPMLALPLLGTGRGGLDPRTVQVGIRALLRETAEEIGLRVGVFDEQGLIYELGATGEPESRSRILRDTRNLFEEYAVFAGEEGTKSKFEQLVKDLDVAGESGFGTILQATIENFSESVPDKFLQLQERLSKWEERDNETLTEAVAESLEAGVEKTPDAEGITVGEATNVSEVISYAKLEHELDGLRNTELSTEEWAARRGERKEALELAEKIGLRVSGDYLNGTQEQMLAAASEIGEKTPRVALRDLAEDPDELLLARLSGRKVWQMLEGEFIAQRHILDMRGFTRAVAYNQTQLSKLAEAGGKQRKEQVRLERELEVWQSVLDDPERRLKYKGPGYAKEYGAKVKKAISTGETVSAEIIAQTEIFGKAKTARERYEKGWNTSFGNMTAAVDDSMQERRGYKVKRQDGKEITPGQKAEIETGVDEIEQAIGPIGDLMRHANVTFAHTNGKYPFLQQAGGLYHASERTISIGIGSKFSGQSIPAQAHEVGHWLDNEAGAMQGVEVTHYTRSRERQTLNFLSEGDNRSYEKQDNDLILDASNAMNRSYEVRRWLNPKSKKETDSERILAEIVSVKLGAYWRDPREVWARLFEQYVSTKLAGKVAYSADKDYTNTPGYWTEEAFAALMPRVEAQITRRVEIIRDGIALENPQTAIVVAPDDGLTEETVKAPAPAQELALADEMSAAMPKETAEILAEENPVAETFVTQGNEPSPEETETAKPLFGNLQLPPVHPPASLFDFLPVTEELGKLPPEVRAYVTERVAGLSGIAAEMARAADRDRLDTTQSGQDRRVREVVIRRVEEALILARELEAFSQEASKLGIDPQKVVTELGGVPEILNRELWRHGEWSFSPNQAPKFVGGELKIEAAPTENSDRETDSVNVNPAIAPTIGQPHVAEKVASRLLHGLGIEQTIMTGEVFRQQVDNPPHLPLIIERRENLLHLTQFKAKDEKTWIENEVIFRIEGEGRLVLHETATFKPEQGEARSGYDFGTWPDRAFATVFGATLEEQGFGNPVPRMKAEVEANITENGQSPTLDDNAGATIGPDREGVTQGSSRLANAVLSKLREGEAIGDNRAFNEMADVAFGGTRASGAYSSRDAYDALETGVHAFVEENAGRWLEQAPGETLQELRALLEKLPRQGDRTQEQNSFQQFSTPPTEAFVAFLATGAREGEVFAEPSGGTAGLAAWARGAGHEVRVNELAPRRRALLEMLGYENVTGVDAQFLNDTLPGEIRPDVILMNPPFSATAGRTSKNNTANGAQHITEALTRLNEGGRLVAITGEGMALGKPAFTQWWSDVMQKYNVRANVSVPGEEYGKYGTTFGTQILVIDKTGRTPGQTLAEQFQGVETREANNLEEVVDVLQRLGDERRATTPAQSVRESDSVARGGNAGGGRDRGELPANEPLAESARVRPDAGNVPAPAGEIGPGEGDSPDVTDRTGVAGDKPGTAPSGELRNRSEISADTGANEDVRRVNADAPATGDNRETPAEIIAATEEKVDTPPVLADSIIIGNTQERGEDAGNDTVRYRPAKLSGGVEHPAFIVESRSMAAVSPPDITYRPHLDQQLIANGNLSNLQYEGVIYAGQRHEQRLPNGMRAGYFIGDGTGLGKGREISGIALDNWNQNRRRIAWFSINYDLVPSAQRDLNDLNATIPLGRADDYKAAANLAENFGDGIMFSSYATLIAQSKDGKTRFDQIVEWLGPDGVIIFDEGHLGKNAVDDGLNKASQRGDKIVELQIGEKSSPEWRIVYASATGATEPRNMAYMQRLGLWSEGTSFPGGFSEFRNAIERGGVGAMEIVSRDMKALGMYCSRTISYRGVDYNTTTHELTPAQENIYNRAAEAWQVVGQEFEKGLEVTGASSRAVSFARSRYFSSQQLFFRQLLTAMNVPSVIEETEKALAEGSKYTNPDTGETTQLEASVVIGLIGTGEARTKDQVSKALANQQSLDNLDFSPKNILLNLVERSFPTQRYVKVDDGNGGTKVVPLTDGDGIGIQSKEALAMRDALLENLEKLTLPDNPLDQIVNYFGAAQVAEITGRDKRLMRDPETGRNSYVKRAREGVSMEKASEDEMLAFQAGRKRIAIISASASTGISLHADNRSESAQYRRVHITLETGWSADTQMQTFGRTHRSDEASAPEYRLMTTNLGGQKRFLSTIAKRLGSLGALTRGDRNQTGGDMQQYDFESHYGEAAARRIVQALVLDEKIATDYLPAKAEGETERGLHILRKMGLAREKDGVLEVPEKTLENLKVSTFLNRVLVLDVATQNGVFEAFAQRMEETIQHDKTMGMFDAGIQDIKGKNIRIAEKPQVVATDPVTGAETIYYRIQADQKTEPVSYAELEMRQQTRGGRSGQDETFWQQKNSKNVIYITEAGMRTNPKSQTQTQMFRVARPNGWQESLLSADELIEHYAKRSRSEIIEDKKGNPTTVRKWWEAQHAEAPEYETINTHIIGGAVLPVWQRLAQRDKHGESVYLKSARVETDDGQRIVGVKIGARSISAVLKELSVQRSFKEPEEIFRAVMEENEQIRLVGGLSLRRTFLKNEKALKIEGAQQTQRHEMTSFGVQEEIMNWREHYFVPSDPERGIPVLEKLLARYPAVETVAETAPETQHRRNGNSAPVGNRTLNGNLVTTSAPAGESNGATTLRNEPAMPAHSNPADALADLAVETYEQVNRSAVSEAARAQIRELAENGLRREATSEEKNMIAKVSARRGEEPPPVENQTEAQLWLAENAPVGRNMWSGLLVKAAQARASQEMQEARLTLGRELAAVLEEREAKYRYEQVREKPITEEAQNAAEPSDLEEKWKETREKWLEAKTEADEMRDKFGTDEPRPLLDEKQMARLEQEAIYRQDGDAIRKLETARDSPRPDAGAARLGARVELAEAGVLVAQSKAEEFPSYLRYRRYKVEGVERGSHLPQAEKEKTRDEPETEKTSPEEGWSLQDLTHLEKQNKFIQAQANYHRQAAAYAPGSFVASQISQHLNPFNAIGGELGLVTSPLQSLNNQLNPYQQLRNDPVVQTGRFIYTAAHHLTQARHFEQLAAEGREAAALVKESLRPQLTQEVEKTQNQWLDRAKQRKDLAEALDQSHQQEQARRAAAGKEMPAPAFRERELEMLGDAAAEARNGALLEKYATRWEAKAGPEAAREILAPKMAGLGVLAQAEATVNQAAGEAATLAKELSLPSLVKEKSADWSRAVEETAQAYVAPETVPQFSERGQKRLTQLARQMPPGEERQALENLVEALNAPPTLQAEIPLPGRDFESEVISLESETGLPAPPLIITSIPTAPIATGQNFTIEWQEVTPVLTNLDSDKDRRRWLEKAGEEITKRQNLTQVDELLTDTMAESAAVEELTAEEIESALVL